jgi:RNA polymerase sigma-B factor
MRARQSTKAEFAEYRRTRDGRLRDELVERYVYFAYAIARRFEGHGEERDDLRQVALIALVQAVERFDPSRGVAFPSFAAPTIGGSLKRHLRDHTWIVRLPRSVNERTLEAAAIVERLTAMLGHEPSVEDVAFHTGWSRSQVEEAMVVLHTHRHSGRRMIDDPDDGILGGVDDAFDRVDDRLCLADLIDCLASRERRIIALRYFEELSQSVIGERVGVSQMHVSRLLRQSMAQLRARGFDWGWIALDDYEIAG